MSSFNNVNGHAAGYPPFTELHSVHLKTGMGAFGADAGSQQDVKPNWSTLLAAAKAAYNHGYKYDALQLYKAGLVEASRTMDDRDELIEFLTVNVWS